MTQTTIEGHKVTRISATLLRDMGYDDAMDYARRMVVSAGTENTQLWKDVIDRIYHDAHPLRFSPVYIPSIINGTKTATTRMRAKLRKGDRFYITGPDHREHLFEIVSVDTDSVKELCNRHYSREACDDPMELYAILKGIYPDITTRTVMTTYIFSEVVV